MVTYVVGDIQGCDATLARLLERLPLEPARDALWFTGDLVNRGPRSLAALRRVVALSHQFGERCVAVLGNHDLHLLARAAGLTKPRRGDTLDDLLAANDRDELLDWLRRQPLLHRQVITCRPAPPGRSGKSDGPAGPGGTDATTGTGDTARDASPAPAALHASVHATEVVLVHAGLHPHWSVAHAARLAGEVHEALCGPDHQAALAAITAGSPDQWDETLAGGERLASIVAVLTRIRTCRKDGRLCKDFKGPPADAPRECTPWYALRKRASRDATVVFGHWAALGLHLRDGVRGLDTGCVWGDELTALRLEDGVLFQQPNVEAG